MSADQGDRHRVVIIGGGFAGLFAARELKHADADVLLIDKTGYHLFQPLLYQVATGILSQGEVARPLREILRRQRNARFLLGQVDHIDLDARTVTSTVLGQTTINTYDSLIVAAGASHSYFGNDQFSEHAPGLKSLDDALEIRARIYEAFELAEQATDHDERCRHLTFVVVGGGPTGVEVAGQIAEIATHSLRRNFRDVDPADARVLLLEAGPVLLPAFGEPLSTRTKKDLERLGVEVLLDALVTDLDEAHVTYLSQGVETRLAATAKVWAAGVAASPPTGLHGTGTQGAPTRSGQMLVQPDCTLAGHPDVFVVGDLMRMPGVPGLAQAAIQSGRFAAQVISARLRGRVPPEVFRYRDKGILATITRFRAVAHIRGIRLTGAPAWVLWLGVHLVTLNGYRNRVTVTMHWAVTFLLNARAERAATRSQARHRVTPSRAAVRPITSATRLSREDVARE